MTTAATTLTSAFTETMAHVCTPVSVITTFDGQHPHGTTVSAVMSLSMDPLLVAIALANTSNSLEVIRAAGSFGVNFLGVEQADIALRFATKSADKFAGISWSAAAGTPRIADCAGWLACAVTDVLDGGDHRIVIGEVTEVDHLSDASPLTYHRRTFGTHAAAS